MMIMPKVIVSVSTVTKRRSRRIWGGSGAPWAVSLSAMNGPIPPLVLTLPDDVPGRLDKALVAAVPADLALSRSRLQALIAEGAVRRGGQALLDAKTRVLPGEVLTLTLPPPAPVQAKPEDIPLDVLHEDATLVIVNKPVGMVVHPAPGAPSGTLVNALLHHCGDSLAGIGGAGRPGIVHRIDKDTSGLLVVAKTDRAHQRLSAQFAAHSVDRLYQALVWGRPDPGDPRLNGLSGVSFEPEGVLRIEAPIGRHKADRKKMAIRHDGGRRAVTRLTVVQGLGPGANGAALMQCRLETGRTHQIRVHAAHVGHPLVGDPVYGTNRKPPGWLSDAAMDALSTLPGQALHAGVLGFEHPETGAALRFQTDPPASFNTLLRALSEIPG